MSAIAGSSGGSLPLGERVALGTAERGRLHPSELAAFDVTGARPDPIALLEAQAPARVAELVPIRYARMAESPFAFYRGAAAVMASDLSLADRTNLFVQLGGDAHLANFGGFASPSRELLFDMNDFDETLPGPFEWDVKRLATSFAIAAHQNGLRGKEARAITAAVVAQYRATIHEFAGQGELDLWYSYFDTATVMARWSKELGAHEAKLFDHMFASARKRDSRHAYTKLTEHSGDVPRFIDEPPLLVRLENLFEPEQAGPLAEAIARFLEDYRSTLPHDLQHLLDRYHFVDVARKVVGVGSVGTRTWVALFLGHDDTDSLILQVKEAQQSVLEPHVGASRYPNSAKRVVEGQRLLQGASDIFLGWGRITGQDGVDRDYYVRQLWNWKLSFDVAALPPEGLLVYGKMCACALARGHARSGDSVAIASYLGDGTEFDAAMTSFAHAYADRNERDHAELVAAIGSGRISATS